MINSCTVATHTGGVDRNTNAEQDKDLKDYVATHTGGVDRNKSNLHCVSIPPTSPPIRVAWIETSQAAHT